MSLFRRGLVVAALALLAFAQPALAAYPDRPITLIVPWGAGGGTDATARIIGSLLEKELGQPVNVVNRVGGSGVVGHAAIAQAATCPRASRSTSIFTPRTIPTCRPFCGRSIASAFIPPRSKPCLRIASAAYSEQLGWYLQVFAGTSGEMSSW